MATKVAFTFVSDDGTRPGMPDNRVRWFLAPHALQMPMVLLELGVLITLWLAANLDWWDEPKTRSTSDMLSWHASIVLLEFTVVMAGHYYWTHAKLVLFRVLVTVVLAVDSMALYHTVDQSPQQDGQLVVVSLLFGLNLFRILRAAAFTFAYRNAPDSSFRQG